MKIRRFFAPDLRQAMRLVQEAQGPEAVILSNRKVEGGVEIVSAIDFDEAILSSSPSEVESAAPAPQPPPSARAAAQIDIFRAVAQTAAAPKPAASTPLRTVPGVKSSTAAPAGGAPVVKSPPAPDPLTTKTPAPPVKSMAAAPKPAAPAPLAAGAAATLPAARIPSYNPPEVRFNANAAENGPETDPQDGAVSGGEPGRRSASEAARSAPRVQENVWAQDPVLVGMRRELKELRGLLEHQLSGLAWSETTRRTPIQAQLLRALSELGLSISLARELAGAVSTVGEFDTAWRHAMGLLAERLTVEEDVILDQGGVVALVGSTGVGKTTTVAKLAAHYALRHGRERVALVTTDSYRIGSQEQLRTFARILGVPMRMAADAAELSQTLEGLTDCGLVLIDTAGMSQRDLRLSEQFATLRGAGREIRSYLVLSAITQRTGLEEVIRAFSEMRIAGCILTKLDEAASLGEAISVMVRHKLPLTYLGVGQRVPEDLLPARAHNLVSRAVDLFQQYAPAIEEESLAMAFGSTHRYAAAL